MNVLFVCTDNFTRSVIAEFCMRDFLRKTNNTSIQVASAGIRATCGISKYSSIHFDMMQSMNIDTSNFTRTQFDDHCFEEYDVMVGMSEIHKQFVKEQYHRDIFLFNEIYNGQSTAVTIGTPESDDFEEQMRQLIQYFYDATPVVVRQLENRVLNRS